MNIYDFAEQKRSSLKQVMDFTSAVNPLGPSQKVRNTLRKALKQLEFPPDEKLKTIYRLIQKRENISRQNIVFGNGIHRIIDAAMKTAGRSIIFSPLPLSPLYRALYSENLTGIDNAIVNEDGFRYRPEVLLEAVTRKSAGIVIIPSPHDVVGSCLHMDQLAAVVSESGRSGAYVLLDESYRDFTHADSPVREVIHSDRTLIVRTFSSYHAIPGLPLGYCIGPSEMIERMREYLPADDINILAPKAAVAALKDTMYTKRTSEFIQKEKEYMIDRLKPLNIELCDTAGPFVILGFESDPEEMRPLFSRYNILIDNPFVYRKRFYIRVPVKQHRMNAAFVKTLRNAIKTVCA